MGTPTHGPEPGVPLKRYGVRDRQSRSEEDFEAWLATVTERLDPFMAWLGVVFALLVGYELAVELSPGAARGLSIAGWVIWALFAIEFAVKLWLAPRRLRFVKRHWFQVAGLLVPALRVLRFLRLARLGRALPAARVVSASYRGLAPARHLLRSRLGYLAAVSVVVAIAAAELAYLFERDTARPAFDTFGDALIWGFSTVLALQGDPVPESAGARIVMIVGFGFGLVIVASLAGTVGAFLIEDRRDREQRF
ncbi:MAG TPA: ion transporter [Thermoleophilaceae bacterium]|nr:ion transporter [Thermoleophilaceae bacterium]